MTDKEKDSSNLEELKKQYEIFKTKYNLPEFSKLNELFDIEEIDADTDFLLRKIRRVISERVSSYSRFADFVLNPSNAPMFFFKILKKLDNSDKESLSSVYETLGNLEVEVLNLDLDYSEKDEAEFINKLFKLFNEKIKLDFLKIVNKMRNGEENNKKEGNSSYFG